MEDGPADGEVVERLRRSEELYARAFNQNPVAMSMTQSETQRIVAANEAFLGLLGYWRAEVIGRTSAQLNLWPSREDRERVGERLQSGGGTGLTRARVRTKRGDLVECLVAHRLLETSSGVMVLSILVPVD